MILFVAAVEAELGGLAGVALGVGPVVAGMAMAECLARGKPDAVILLGTAGAFREDISVGSIWAAGRMGWSDPLGTSKTGYMPIPPPQIEGDIGLVGLPGLRVLTNLGVTTSPEVAAEYGACWDLEHMEVAAVALACQRAGIRFGAVLGVTNQVGPHAHTQWRANRASVEARIQAYASTRAA